MKRNILVYGILVLSLVMVGCKKDSVVTLRLQSQDYEVLGGQSKTYLDENGFTCWNSGDMVKINANDCPVTVTSSGASISNVPTATDFYAIYPAECVTSTSVAASTTINLPAVQYYEEDGNGKQKLKAPIAAKTNSDRENILFCKNLCSILKVFVPAEHVVHNINIRTSSSNLSGTAIVTFSEYEPSLGTVSGNNYVSLNCGSNGVHTGAQGKYFYVVVPSIGAGETITVSIVAQVDRPQRRTKHVWVTSSSMNNSLLSNNCVTVKPWSSENPFIYSNDKAEMVTAIRGVTNSFINTYISATEGTRLDMYFETVPLSVSYQKYGYLYGINGPAQTNRFLYGYRTHGTDPQHTTDVIMHGNRTKTRFISDSFSAESVKMKLSHTPTSFNLSSLDGGAIYEETYSTPGSYTCDNIYLLTARNQDNTTATTFRGNLYAVRIKNANSNILQFYGIPVRIQTSVRTGADNSNWDVLCSTGLIVGTDASPMQTYVCGLYDYVTGQFFTSIGNTGFNQQLDPEDPSASQTITNTKYYEIP